MPAVKPKFHKVWERGRNFSVMLALGALCLACNSNTTTSPDSGNFDAGIPGQRDAVILTDANPGPDVLGFPDAQTRVDADIPDAGFERFPQGARLRSEGRANYKEPLAITSNPNDPTLSYFSAMTPSGNAAIFQLNEQGTLRILHEGAPLVMPVALMVNSNGRLLYIADLVANNVGQIFSLDLRLETLEELAPLNDFGDPAGVSFDPDIPSILFTGRFPGTNNGAIWELQAADVSPMPIPLDPTLVMNDPSHLVRLQNEPTIYLYDSHFEETQLGRIYRILNNGDFSIVSDNIASNYPAGIDFAIDESYLLVSTSTPATNGGDTIHIVDLAESPPSRRPLVLEQKLKEPRGIHRIRGSNRWLVIDGRGGSTGNGAIYELE